MKPVIRVEGVSKQYRIGTRHSAHHGSLKQTLSEIFRSAFKVNQHQNGDSPGGEWVWVLKDVGFEVMPGEIVGIIGRNGAGKSTLLKILSRVCEPTSGRVELYGRLGSLLEIGTGFHPELTGRENVYLNGAILGMARREIDRKFDEIVDFSEIEKFLDTPVKHYSSGMYMRLAFSVAVHLEPEVLVMDEVLAVGDVAFQKKCLEKMARVARGGRTVLFVSHSLSSVSELCNRVILLKDGKIEEAGPTEQVIDSYLREVSPTSTGGFTASTHDRDMLIAEAQTFDPEGRVKSCFTHNEDILIAVKCKINRWVPNTVMGFNVTDHRGRKVFTANNPEWSRLEPRTGEVGMTVKIPRHFLVPGKYVFTFAVNDDWVENVLPIVIADAGSDFARFEGGDYGCVFANCEWTLDSV
ncbi:MAG: lipopolysaccharide transport system ATP-binding protein [Blastocatellia bacterium]|jgi:lipopolysaccharide transport system ATP-binding protein|nr:lipopolysaccharide transport system ATP-binding protein [Blastocatellia bacterium]